MEPSTSDSPAGVYGSVSISISSRQYGRPGTSFGGWGTPKKGGKHPKGSAQRSCECRPLRFTLTGGQEQTQANELIAGMESEYVIADRAYDSNQFLESVIGAVPDRIESYRTSTETSLSVSSARSSTYASSPDSTSWQTGTSASFISSVPSYG